MPDPTQTPRLILLPGMAADWRLFTHQIKVFETLEIPPWLPTKQHETLATYAQRMAATIEPSEPYFLGGASLGGMLALEMVRHLRPAPRGIFLIGSCRHGRVVPVTLRRLEVINPLIPTVLFDWFKHFVVPLRKNRLTPEQRRLFSDMYRDTPGSFVKWACTAIVRWPGVAHVDVPVYHIHGSRDRILPLRRGVAPDHVIPGGGHLISLSHPKDVNAFIRERMAATLSQR